LTQDRGPFLIQKFFVLWMLWNSSKNMRAIYSQKSLFCKVFGGHFETPILSKAIVVGLKSFLKS